MRSEMVLGGLLALSFAAAAGAQNFLPGEVLTAARLNLALATPVITGGTINGAVIGASNPQPATFTTLATTAAVTLSGGAVSVLGSGGFTVGDNTARQVTTLNSFINPVSGAMSPSLLVQGNAFGTITSGTLATYRAFNINADSVNAAGSQGGGAAGNYFGHTLSAGAVGGRTTLFTLFSQQGATTAALGQYYVSLAGFAEAAASAGGSAGVGTQRGNLFGANVASTLKTGAGIHWNQVVGQEINVGIQTGAAAIDKVGLQIVQWQTDAVRGVRADAALVMANQSQGTAPGWTVLYQLGAGHGWWPLQSGGAVMQAADTVKTLTGPPPPLATHGIDFATVPIVFSGSAFAAPGFRVDGTGQLTLGPATIGWSGAGLALGSVGRTAVLASVAAGGTAYVVGDVLRDDYGGVWAVATVASGAITGLTLHKAPSVTSGAAPSNPRALAGGGGGGATINLTWTLADRTTLNGRVVLASPTVPGSAGAACTAGEHAWDASFLYACVATNTWKRAAIATW